MGDNKAKEKTKVLRALKKSRDEKIEILNRLLELKLQKQTA